MFQSHVHFLVSVRCEMPGVFNDNYTILSDEKQLLRKTGDGWLDENPAL